MSSSPSLAAGIPNSSVPCIVTDLFMVSIFFFSPKGASASKEQLSWQPDIQEFHLNCKVLLAGLTALPCGLRHFPRECERKWPKKTSTWVHGQLARHCCRREGWIYQYFSPRGLCLELLLPQGAEVAFVITSSGFFFAPRLNRTLSKDPVFSIIFKYATCNAWLFPGFSVGRNSQMSKGSKGKGAFLPL